MKDELLKLQMLEHLEQTDTLGSHVTFFSHENKYYIYEFHLYPEKAELEQTLLDKFNAMDRLECEQFGMRFKNHVKIHLVDGRTILELMGEMGVDNFEIKSQNKIVWN